MTGVRCFRKPARTAEHVEQLGYMVLIRAALVRVICSLISPLGILAPYRGLAEDGNQLPGNGRRFKVQR
jgi:hypothetical protein